MHPVITSANTSSRSLYGCCSVANGDADTGLDVIDVMVQVYNNLYRAMCPVDYGLQCTVSNE